MVLVVDERRAERERESTYGEWAPPNKINKGNTKNIAHRPIINYEMHN
jgi:hypothetical protein